MKTKISKLLIKECILKGEYKDPVLYILVAVTYRSQIIKQFKYKRWADMPLSYRDFICDPETECREWDKDGAVTMMHCTEYSIKKEVI